MESATRVRTVTITLWCVVTSCVTFELPRGEEKGGGAGACALDECGGATDREPGAGNGGESGSPTGAGAMAHGGSGRVNGGDGGRAGDAPSGTSGDAGGEHQRGSAGTDAGAGDGGAWSAGGSAGEPEGGSAGTGDSDEGNGGAPACPGEVERSCNVDLWPQGIVAYEFQGNWSAERRADIERTMDSWQLASQSMVQFVPRAGEEVYARLELAGCEAARGRSSQVTSVKIGDCSEREALITLGRMLGLGAHHLRADRDRAIRISEPICTPPVFEPTPTRCNDGNTTDYGPYDVHSIMQPSSEDFEPGCAARGDCSVRTARGAIIASNQLISGLDGAALLELYSENRGWTRMKPVVTAPVDLNEPLVAGLPNGSAKGAPALVATGESLEAFVLGDDEHLYERAIDWDNRAVAPWSRLDLGVRLESGPAVLSSFGALDLVGVTTDGLLSLCHREGRNWSACETIDPPSGTGAVSAPLIVRTDAQALLLVVFRDGQMYVRNHEALPADWTIVPGRPWQGTPAGASFAPGRIDLFARSADSPDQILTTTLTNMSWVGYWVPLGGTLRAGTSPSAATLGNLSLDVYATGASGHLLRKTFRPNLAWGDFVPVGGLLAREPAVAVAWDRIYVLAELREAGFWLGSW